jgi:TRAP-type C4-dicarboxylate transport system permease small subunit
VRSLERWLWRCELALVYAGVLATFLMMCLTSADALCRYLLNSPIMGAYEITEKYLMVAAIFLGLSYAYRGGVFIRVTFLVDRLPPALKQVANHVAHLLSLAFCAFILVATGQQAWRGLHDDTTLSALPLLSRSVGISRADRRNACRPAAGPQRQVIPVPGRGTERVTPPGRRIG